MRLGNQRLEFDSYDYLKGTWRVALVVLALWVIYELTRRVYAEHKRQTTVVSVGNVIGGVKVPTNFIGCWGPEAIWSARPDFVDVIQYAPVASEEDSGVVSYVNIARWARNRYRKFRSDGSFYRYFAIATLPVEQSGEGDLIQFPGVAFAFNTLTTLHRLPALACTVPCQGPVDMEEWSRTQTGDSFYWTPGNSETNYFCGLLNGSCSSSYECDSELRGPMQLNPYGAGFAVYRTPNAI